MKKFLRAAGYLFTGLLLLLMLAAAAMGIAERRTPPGFLPRVAGDFVAAVMSDSMHPTFSTGDVIVVRPLTPAQANDLRVGQIVTYRTGSAHGSAPILVTHRIVGVATVRNLKTGRIIRFYRLKGDANNAPDQLVVAPQEIVGRYAWHIPYVGYFAVWVRQPLGFLLMVGLPALFLIGEQFLRLWREFGKADRRPEELPQTGISQGGGEAR